MADPHKDIEHPSPHHHRVSTGWLLAGLSGAAAAWVLQLLIEYGVSSNACTLTQGHNGQAPITGFGGEPLFLLGVNVGCLALAVGAGILSWRHWLAVKEEKGGDIHSQLTIGEGRTRFLALAGMLSSATFSLAILFNTIEPILIPPCWSFR